MNPISLGEKIKLLRKKNGMTQRQLADAVPISFSTFRRWETGENKPNIQIISRLAEILHTSVAYLSGELDESAPIIGSSFIRFLEPNEPIEETVTSKYTPIVEQKIANFTYWGSVLDETRNAINRGDVKEISVIETLLNSACEMIADSKKQSLTATKEDDIGSVEHHLNIHDNTMKAKHINVGTAPVGTSS